MTRHLHNEANSPLTRHAQEEIGLSACSLGLAWTSRLVALVAICNTVLAGEAPAPLTSRPTAGHASTSIVVNAKFALFQDFVNGKVPIKEAVVYRKITKPDSSWVNLEWWRFGYQENTWFVQRLQPDPSNSSNLVPLWNHEVCGASYAMLWLITDRDVEVAPKQSSTGSLPEINGSLPRSLVHAALSLSLPRQFDKREISEVPFAWEGTHFRTVRYDGPDEKGTRITVTQEGDVKLGVNGLPALAQWSDIHGFRGGKVAYEYGPDTQGVPVAFTAQGAGDVHSYRYQFLALKLASNDLSETEGYVPGLFADMKLARTVSISTNDQYWILIKGQFVSGARPAHVYGEGPKRKGPLILISLAFGASTILALWYQRAEKKKQTNKAKGQEP